MQLNSFIYSRISQNLYFTDLYYKCAGGAAFPEPRVLFLGELTLTSVSWDTLEKTVI